MHIARFVARDALRTERVRVECDRVAGMTFQLGVLARKLPVSVANVIEVGRLPFRGTVTAGAIRPESSRMRILALMAAIALLGNRGLHIPGPVAVVAFQVRMFSRERESGFLRVIESGGLPSGRGMATRAFGSAFAPMHVIGRVARYARGRRFLVSIPEVTFATLH